MRIRTVKPEYWAHRMHARLSESAALVSLALLNFSDDEGRFEADSVQITSVMFPRRALTRSVEECLAELVSVRWIVMYDGNVDGEKIRLGQIVKFTKHQFIAKPRKSSFPCPPEGMLPEASGSDTGMVQPRRKEASTFRDGMTTSFKETLEEVALQPLMDRIGEDRKEGGTGAHTPLANGSGHQPEAEWPTEAQVLKECSMQNIDAGLGSKFWRYYESRNPRWDGIGNWRLKLVDWNVRERERGEGPNIKKNGTPAQSPELLEISAELQWQQEPARIEALKKRRRELGG